MAAPPKTYGLGQRVRTSVTFDVAGAPVDPDAVTVRVRRPDTLAITIYVYGVNVEVVRTSAGRYRMDIDGSVVGEWVYAWRGTGTFQGGTPDKTFIIAETVFD